MQVPLKRLDDTLWLVIYEKSLQNVTLWKDTNPTILFIIKNKNNQKKHFCLFLYQN
jgi:hypothetical protein